MLIDSKSNLARLMATENLIIEQRRVPTAFFDIKNRVLTVPILNGNLSPELYDLLLGHEVGHALETPEAGWHHSVVELKEVSRTTVNICEDVRIEKKIKRRFPGIRPSFLKGYKELMDMDFFGVKGKDLNALNFLDRLNLHSKGGYLLNIRFNKEETDLVEETEDAETFDETIAVAKKIEAYMKKQEKKEKEKQKSNDHEFKEPSLAESDELGDGTEQNRENENSFDDGIEEEDEEEEGGNLDKQGMAGSTDGKYRPVSITDESFREKEKELVDTSARKEYVYSSIPTVKLDKVIIPYKELYEKFDRVNSDEVNDGFYNPKVLLDNYNAFRKESNRVVSFLVKEFELRKNADQLSRAKVSKTGELNMSKISDYKFTDDIFKRITKVPNGKSHGLVMYIDWSGSMSDHINSTIKQLLNLAMFCRKVNIPFEVYAISSKVNSNDLTQYKNQDLKIGDIVLHKDFCLPNILSSKMSAKEFTNAASILLDFGAEKMYITRNVVVPEVMNLGGTPLNEAIISAFDMVPNFKRDNKLQIVNTVILTDGQSVKLAGRCTGVNQVGAIETVESICPWFKSRQSFVRDPITKAVVEIKMPSSTSTYSAFETKALLTLLKQRIGGNLIGFFVTSSRGAYSCINTYNQEYEEKNIADTKIREFKRNNSTVLTNAGYDDYYILRSDKLDIEDEDFFVTPESVKSTKSLVNAFSKYNNKKISNRIVLNRFINLIT